MTPTAVKATGPHNHFNCSRGCSKAPLTLADKLYVLGRWDVLCRDESTGTEFCGDCLADLPADSYEALFHICATAA